MRAAGKICGNWVSQGGIGKHEAMEEVTGSDTRKGERERDRETERQERQRERETERGVGGGSEELPLGKLTCPLSSRSRSPALGGRTCRYEKGPAGKKKKRESAGLPFLGLLCP